MARSMLAAVAEAMNRNVDDELSAPGEPLNLKQDQSTVIPVRDLSVPEQIVQNWNGDPSIRTEFKSQSTYAAWYGHEAAKKSGISASQLQAQTPDVSGYLARLEGKLAPGENLAISGYADTWRDSPEIRAEFRTFEVYAAYMRARARGHGRTQGH